MSVVWPWLGYCQNDMLQITENKLSCMGAFNLPIFKLSVSAEDKNRHKMICESIWFSFFPILTSFLWKHLLLVPHTSGSAFCVLLRRKGTEQGQPRAVINTTSPRWTDESTSHSTHKHQRSLISVARESSYRKYRWQGKKRKKKKSHQNDLKALKLWKKKSQGRHQYFNTYLFFILLPELHCAPLVWVDVYWCCLNYWFSSALLKILFTAKVLGNIYEKRKRRGKKEEENR